MSDRPLMGFDSPVLRMEVAAMNAYREKYPDGPLWQELHGETRVMWLLWIEKRSKEWTP